MKFEMEKLSTENMKRAASNMQQEIRVGMPASTIENGSTM